MDLLTLVREIGKTPDTAAPDRIARSREHLLASLPDGPSRRPRRRWVLGGSAALGSLVAAATVAAVVIGGTVAPVVSQPASAAAIDVLNEAAGVVITGVDPAVGAGQYLFIRETFDLVRLWDIDDDSDLSDPVTGFNSPLLKSSEGALFLRGTRDLYVPRDRTGDWVLDDRAPTEVIDVVGDPGTLAAYERLTAKFPESDADPGGIEALPGGLQEYDPKTTEDDRYWDQFRESYDDIPREPRALLAWYREHLFAEGDDWVVFQSVGRTLSSDVMPADLRAASLHVLGLLNGVDVAGKADTVVTLEMPVQQGGDDDFGGLLVSELDIDTSTGRIVGVRESYPNHPTDLWPAGVPWVSWKIDVTVVDQAPTP